MDKSGKIRDNIIPDETFSKFIKGDGHSLVVCEKPDAAKRIAEALGKVKEVELGYLSFFSVEDSKKRYLVCSALGHLYTVADTSGQRKAYPVFDVDWLPIHLVEKEKAGNAARIELIKGLSKRCNEFINACDFDIEGETIGYNVLKYACGGREGSALRAKFSTLTRDELKEAFRKAKPGLGKNLAEAGRTRHLVDFLYGVNLSRALSESFYAANNKYRTLSAGRVQSPTLSYIVDREVEVRTFLPSPFWLAEAFIEAKGGTLIARYEVDKISILRDANKVKEDCEGKDGIVSQVKKTVVRHPPPTPFNTGDLQKEAYRVFGFSPSQTLAMAERLYLDALISYPRTSSQKLPPSIDYKKILSGLRSIGSYRKDCGDLLSGRLVPKEGEKDDPAHPSVYPTGEHPQRELEAREAKLFDLIVRRFFSVFGEDALRERVSAKIDVGVHVFRANGRRTLEEGWIRFYRAYTEMEDSPIPPLEEGEVVKMKSVKIIEKFEQPPPRYNQSSLLEKMEKEGIGTKATRAEIIRTLFDRGYVIGESAMATELGFSIVESMRNFSPIIISTEMTKKMETEIEEIELGRIQGEEVLEEAIETLLPTLARIRREEIPIGKEIRRAIIATVMAQNLLGPCPLCKTGKLTVIRSRRTRKRFVGCTNYSNGCRASAPLPQKGRIKPGKPCPVCEWPIIYVRLSRIPWKLCVNISCPTKAKGKEKIPPPRAA